MYKRCGGVEKRAVEYNSSDLENMPLFNKKFGQCKR